LVGGRLGEDGELPVSDRLDELLHVRIDALAPEVCEILVLAALLAAPKISLLERACDQDVNRALARARLAGIVSLEQGRIRFTHPLLASTGVAHVDEVRRCGLHRRLAEIVGSQEERARHLALATTEPDADLAALLEETADSSRARGAQAAAAELLGHARRLTPRGDRAAWA